MNASLGNPWVPRPVAQEILAARQRIDRLVAVHDIKAELARHREVLALDGPTTVAADDSWSTLVEHLRAAWEQLVRQSPRLTLLDASTLRFLAARLDTILGCPDPEDSIVSAQMAHALAVAEAVDEVDAMLESEPTTEALVPLGALQALREDSRRLVETFGTEFYRVLTCERTLGAEPQILYGVDFRDATLNAWPSWTFAALLRYAAERVASCDEQTLVLPRGSGPNPPVGEPFRRAQASELRRLAGLLEEGMQNPYARERALTLMHQLGRVPGDGSMCRFLRSLSEVREMLPT